MIYNYHAHTYHCRHATGTLEEYVIRAIENGIKYMGFSDHIPLRFKDGIESSYRVPTNEGEAYCLDVKALAEKYKNKIEIKLGFEMEYYPELFEQMLESAKEYGAEYLILGQHYLVPENTIDTHTIRPTDDVAALEKYVKLVISAMNERVFTYVAHPDIINFTGDADVYKECMREICRESAKLNVPLELNLLGIRELRNYPKELFWQIAGEEGSPVTFGMDAHRAVDAYDGVSIVKAKALVEKYGLNYIGKPTLVVL